MSSNWKNVKFQTKFIINKVVDPYEDDCLSNHNMLNDS